MMSREEQIYFMETVKERHAEMDKRRFESPKFREALKALSDRVKINRAKKQ